MITYLFEFCSAACVHKGKRREEWLVDNRSGSLARSEKNCQSAARTTNFGQARKSRNLFVRILSQVGRRRGACFCARAITAEADGEEHLPPRRRHCHCGPPAATVATIIRCDGFGTPKREHSRSIHCCETSNGRPRRLPATHAARSELIATF